MFDTSLPIRVPEPMIVIPAAPVDPATLVRVRDALERVL